VVVDYVVRDSRLAGMAVSGTVGQRPGLGEPASPAAAATPQHQALDPLALGGYRRGGGAIAGAHCRDRARQLALGLWGERKPCNVAPHAALRYHADAFDYKVNHAGRP
jgi:hypothetical protein